MSMSRRDIIKTALASAIAVSTPQSLLAFADRGAPPQDRYLLLTLRNGNLVAIDRLGKKEVYLLKRVPAPDGDYALAQPGRVRIRKGLSKRIR